MKLRDRQDVDNRELVFARSLAGVQRWLSVAWSQIVEDPPLRVTFHSSLEADRQIAIASGEPEHKRDRLPWAAIMQASVQNRTTGPTASWQAFTFGMDMAKRPEGNGVGRLPRDRSRRGYILPVTVGLGIRFRTSSIEEGRVFSSIWLRHQPNFAFDVIDKESGARFRVRCIPDGIITTPQNNDVSSVHGQVFDYEVTMLVETYLGYFVDSNVIKKAIVGIGMPTADDVNKLLLVSKLEIDAAGRITQMEF